jgi:hypothetical protein
MPTKEVSNQDIKKLVDSSDKLVKRIDKLVSLFEVASKNVSEVTSAEEKVRALSEKLEDLLDQNRTIAKGLLMLEKYVRGKTGIVDAPSTSGYEGL